MNAKRFGVGVPCLTAFILALLFQFSLHQNSRAVSSAAWTLTFDSPNSEIYSLAAYNGKLYAVSHNGDQTNGKLYAFDGTTWTDTNFEALIGVTVDLPQALIVFNGRLYIGVRVDVGGTKYTRVYYYDGTNFTEDLSRYGESGYSAILDFVVHNNTLYTANASMIGEVYQRISDNHWVTVGSGAVDPSSWVSALASYNGSLYAGTGGIYYHPKVYRWGGTAWELAIDFHEQFGVTQDGVTNLKVVNGLLYASIDGGVPPSPIYIYDGSSWSLSKSIAGCRGAKLEVVDDQIWAGTCNGSVYRLNGSNWEDLGTTGEVYVTDFARYGDRIFAATTSNGRIFYTYAGINITLGIDPPPDVHAGSLIYIPVSLSRIDTSLDVRGVQFGLRVSDEDVLVPADDQQPRLGALFPADSLTYTVAVTNGWDFMLAAPLMPAPPSGTGIIVELPFYAQAEGCVDLTFADHILVNSSAITISHQIQTGHICLIEQGNLAGATYLQSRASGFYTGTLVALDGSFGTYTTTTDATGYFAITDIDSGVYTATFTHPLFIHAIRQDITITDQMTNTLSDTGLWAGDLNQDGDVDESDWYLCAAASIPVDDPAFDINVDGVTDIRDCVILAMNLQRPNMPGTNPPRTGLAALAQTLNRATGIHAVGTVILVPQGSKDVLLRVVNVNGRIYATGARLSLPAGATVTGVELRDGFSSGFLNWHQDNDQLYIVAAPGEDTALTRDTDLAIIHITGESGEAVILEAQSPVGELIGYSVYLAIISR